MATVNFNLRVTKSHKPQLVYLIYRNNNEKLQYSTGFKIKPDDWNTKKGRVKNVFHVANREQINNYLNELQTAVLTKTSELNSGGQNATKELIRDFLDLYTGKKQPIDNSLFGFIDRYINESATRINPLTGKSISYRTIQKYRTSLNKLVNFAEHRKAKIDFKDIDLDFYNEFTEYLTKGLNQSTNTIGKEIQTLKVFLNAASEMGINTHQMYKRKSFKVISEESEAVYLNEKELTKLYNLDLKDNKRLEKVRDLFLLGCWTGLRFSDFTSLRKDSLKDGFINIEQQKTGAKVAIPLHFVVKNIWDKYGGNLPDTISNQKFNQYIQEVCKLAKIDTLEHKGITKGGIRRSERYKKYQLVTSHTARRSFASNLYRSGFPAISIMQITGHKTEKAFLKYIKLDTQEHAKMLQAHWAKTGAYLKFV